MPRAGRARRPSQAAATRGRMPLPSPPRTRTVGPLRSTSQGGEEAPASAPQIQKPESFASASQSARLRTRAISRCSTAPAEALQVDRGHLRRPPFGDHDARPHQPARPSGRPPRGCAGPEPGRGRRSARPPCAAGRSGRRRDRDRPRRRRPDGRASRRAARAPRPRSPAPARPGARAACLARPPAPAVSRRSSAGPSKPFGTSRAPSAPSRTSQPSSASRSRISSARSKSFAARASSRSTRRA